MSHYFDKIHSLNIKISDKRLRLRKFISPQIERKFNSSSNRGGMEVRDAAYIKFITMLKMMFSTKLCRNL